MKIRVIIIMLFVFVLIACEGENSALKYQIDDTNIIIEAIDYHEVNFIKVEGEWLYYSQNKKNISGEAKDFSVLSKVNYNTGEIVELFNIKGYAIRNFINVKDQYFGTVCDFTRDTGFNRFDCDVMHLNTEELLGLNEENQYERFDTFEVYENGFQFQKDTDDNTMTYKVSLDNGGFNLEELAVTKRVGTVESLKAFYSANESGDYDTIFIMSDHSSHFFGGKYYIEVGFSEYQVFYDDELIHTSYRSFVGAIFQEGKLIISDQRFGPDVVACQNYSIDQEGNKSKFKNKFCFTSSTKVSDDVHFVTEFKTYSTMAEANQPKSKYFLKVEDDLVFEELLIEDLSDYYPLFSLEDGNFLAINSSNELFLVKFE